MAKKDNIMLSEFIGKLKCTVINMGEGANVTKTKTLITMLEKNLEEKGDFEFDLDKMLKHFGL
jgi:putative methionine-R-sulfoxide reductase with GAF domain